MTQFTQHTTGKEVVETFADRVNGKTIVITGPSEGSIGGETVLALAAAKPKAIFLCARTKERIQPVIDAFAAKNSETKLEFVSLDLSDLESARKAAATIASQTSHVDVLFNNAGVMTTMPYKETKQGFEWQFGINFLGHFVLTARLMPLLFAASPPAVIVNTSSTGYALGDIPWDNLNWSNGADYHPWLAYAASKTASNLFTLSLATKLKKSGITAFALQPGMPDTNLAAHLPDEGLASIKEAQKINTERFGGEEQDLSGDEKTPESASSTLLAAAFDPSLKDHSGEFLRNCAPFEIMDYAKDPNDAEKLWKLTEDLTKEKFPLEA